MYVSFGFMPPKKNINFVPTPIASSIIGVGRNSDLGGGGATFFYQQKCDFLLLLVDINEDQDLQYCSTAMKFINPQRMRRGL